MKMHVMRMDRRRRLERFFAKPIATRRQGRPVQFSLMALMTLITMLCVLFAFISWGFVGRLLPGVGGAILCWLSFRNRRMWVTVSTRLTVGRLVLLLGYILILGALMTIHPESPLSLP